MIKRKILEKKLKMVDVGEPIRKGVDCCMPTVSPSTSTKYYPTLFLSAEQFPYLKGKDVGTTCKLVLEGKIRSHSLNEHIKGNKKESFDLEINKLGEF